MENQTIQTPIQGQVPNKPSKRFPVLSIVFIIISVLLLFFTAFLAYQNMQLQKQITSMQIAQSSTPTLISNVTIDSKDVQNNNWRTYDGPGLSFQYPNSWADPKVENEGTKQTLNFEGTMSIEAGTVFDNSLKRSLTYDEYVKYITPLEGSILSSSVVGGRTGVRFNEKDIDGNMVVKIVIPDGLDKNFIYTIAYYSHISTWNDAATMAGEVLDSILATFKFKN